MAVRKYKFNSDATCADGNSIVASVLYLLNTTQKFIYMPIFPPELLATVALVINALLWGVLTLYTNYQTHLIFLAWKFRKKSGDQATLVKPLPKVTVQIPVYNEGALVKRILNSVSELDYPSELLEIQLLDDSGPQDYGLNKVWISELRDRGVVIHHLHRQIRDGYKAGALKDGMRTAEGGFILILDADFRAPRDLIYQLIPWFNDPDVAMVQGVWSHPDQGRSLIERVSGYWIERHFSVEQFARSKAGHFFHFNGTAGMWRKDAIIDSGNWNADTLAEDLDLSLRTWRKQWKFIFDDCIQVPCDLPTNARALKIQQARWSTGAFQVARKHLFNLKGVPVWGRMRLYLHLTGYMFPILLLGIAALTPLTSWAYSQHGSHQIKFWAIELPAIIFTASLVVTVVYRFITGGIRSGILELQAAVVGLGLAPTLAAAGFRGLLSKGGEFKRTPKSGRPPRTLNLVWFSEFLIGGLAVYGAYYSFQLQVWWNIPISMMAGIGLFYFFLTGLLPTLGGTPQRTAQEASHHTA